MERCVILNGDYTYLNSVSWKRAIRLMIKGKTEVLKYGDKVLNLVDGSVMKIPAVMKLMKVIRLIYKHKVPYSKKNIHIRDNNECVYCGSNRELTIDHVIPVSRGGKTSFENCVTSCRKCNHKKGSRTPHESNMYLKKQPYAPTISEFFRIRMKQLGIETYLKEIGVF